MRYALRNIDKIKAHFEPNGDRVIKRINDSLTQELRNRRDIIDLVVKNDEKYPIISINDTEHSCGIILFYVIGHKYDVVRLAFKEFIN